ncbi:hypothetical protein [Bdellovibrio sp. HCB337]|uniref:hypothetical protein n=1 Tax=Bdellovibrio sp. HCB337 TaxID=3394358 RepID=UPI0039A5055A
MKKIILTSALIFPFFSLASTGFTSHGVGHDCYQDFSDAIADAQKDADRNAANMCGEVRAWRVSEFQIVGNGGYCTVRVKAEYVCQ